MLLGNREYNIMVPPPQSSSTSAQYPTEEPPFKSPDREASTDVAEEMFSPTSAAALALSTLCGAGAGSFNRASGEDPSRQRPASLSRTRLFNIQQKQNGGNNYTSIHPSRSRPVANAETSMDKQAPPTSASWNSQQQPPYNPSPSASPRYYPSTNHPAAPEPWPEHPGGHRNLAYPTRPGYLHPQNRAPYRSRGPSPTMHEDRYAMEMKHPRSSPRAGGLHPFYEQTNTKDDKPLSRLASHATTLVTPTPKKQKTAASSAKAPPSSAASAKEYSRKKKSLGILAENFLNSYQKMPPGSTIIVDEAAVRLGVERRRIYDVVNILEAICLVSKKHKNTYSWLGKDTLDGVFGRLQAQAIQEYPHDAQRFGLEGRVSSDEDRDTVPLKPPRRQKSDKVLLTRENKSLAKLSQEFLQVFLVGHVTLSLPEASDKIQGTTSVEELIAIGGQGSESQDAKELKAAAARGLKTKIRRLYDIANVFLSVGLLEKVDSGDSSRRPNFSWSYRLSAQQIHELHSSKTEKTTTDTAASAPAVVTQPDEQ